MSQATQRLFFALWPNAGLQRKLHGYAQRMQQAFGGRVVATDNIHLTLVFVGSLPLRRIDELRAIGSALRANRFDLNLARAGCWKRSQVGWIAPEHVPASLDFLVAQLRERLSRAGIAVDDKPFRPHVTLVRKTKCNATVPPPGMRIVWAVNHFALVSSTTLPTGPVYATLDEWPMD